MGIPGIVVKLYTDGTAACNTLAGTATTDAYGKYLFVNLAAGRYCVIVPEGGTDNPFLGGFTRTAGTNPHNVTLVLNQNYLDADFGYAGKGEIRGVVYYDWNQNQVKGLGEAGIPNTQVCLFADNAPYDGAKDSTTPIACTDQ